MKIGFIGLGIMGSRMAANLQRCGYSLVIHNRTPQKAEPLLAKGAKWAASPAELAPEVEVLFPMLAHPDAVREAALGENCFLPRLARGGLWHGQPILLPVNGYGSKSEADSVPRRSRDRVQ